MKNDSLNYIDFTEFKKVKLQVGTIIKAEKFEEAIKPAYKLWIKFNENNIKKSSAQITINYAPEDLINRQVICVVNFSPKQIGNFISEVLVTGFEDAKGNVVLAVPDKPVPDGSTLY